MFTAQVERNEMQTSTHPVRHKVFTVIGIILCVILIPIVIINCTLIAKQFLNKDEVPSVGGIFPMIVLTDSMEGTFSAGSLIVCTTVEADDVHVGEIICYFDPAGNGTTTTTHRVQEIKNEGGNISFVTKGDANNAADAKPVPANKLIGRYVFHIAGLGSVAMFMQTTPGLIIFAALPIILLIAYDVLRRRNFYQKQSPSTDALLAELEALRAEKASQTGKLPTITVPYEKPAQKTSNPRVTLGYNQYSTQIQQPQQPTQVKPKVKRWQP